MLSIPHLIIIFLVALVVLGPEKLPQVARVLGKAMADFRRITNDFRGQIEDEMQEMERQTRIRQELAAHPIPPEGVQTADAPNVPYVPVSPEVPLEPGTPQEPGQPPYMQEPGATDWTGEPLPQHSPAAEESAAAQPHETPHSIGVASPEGHEKSTTEKPHDGNNHSA